MSPLSYEKVKSYISLQKEIFQQIPLKTQLENHSKDYDALLAFIKERNARVYTQNQPVSRKYSSQNFSNKKHSHGLRTNQKFPYNQNKPSNFRKSSYDQQQQFNNNLNNRQQNEQNGNLIMKQQESQEVKEIKQKLVESQNLYLESQKNKSDEQKLVSEIRFKLNSLSPDNLDTVQQKIVELLGKITIEQFQEQISEQIVKKAIDDEKYSNTFAQLFNYIFQNNHRIRKLILKHLDRLFKGSRKLHITKKSYQEMSEIEETDFLQKRRRKFLQLANLLGNLYKFDVLPRYNLDSYLFRSLQLMCEQYDFYLHLKKQNKKEDLENDYNYMDYLEFIICIIDKAGPRLEQQLMNKLKTSVYNEKLSIERNQILGLQEYLIETRKTMGDSILMVDDLDIFKKNQEKKLISIQGYFHILDICCCLKSNIIDINNVQLQIGDEGFNESYEENNNNNQQQQQQNQFKEQSQEIADIRLQVIIQNLKERRKEGWQIRTHIKNNTAVTKQEIQDEVQKLKLMKQQNNNQNEKQKKYINVDYDEDDFDEDEIEDDQQIKNNQQNQNKIQNNVENCLQSNLILTPDMRED